MGRAVQELTAARLGRGFLPLAALFVWGLVQVLFAPMQVGAWVLVVGAPCTAGIMLGHGLRGVKRAFGRPEAWWMALLGPAALLPPVFGLYVACWRGLRTVAGGGLEAAVVGLVMTALGVWALRSWLKVLEVGRLGDTMSGIGAGLQGLDLEGGEPWAG